MTDPLLTARRLGGAARTATLTAAGATPGDISSALRRGTLVRLGRGWLALPDAPGEVTRALGMGGRVACISAARLHRLWTPREDERLHVAVPRHAGHVGEHPPDAVRHWQSDSWTRHPFVVEPVVDLVRQMLLCCEREDALAVIDSALNTGALSKAALSRLVRTLPPRFQTVPDEADSRSESGLETFCRVRFVPMGLPVRTQVHIPGVGNVDMVIGDRIVVEADGKEWHEGADAFIRDRSRDLALVRLGYVVIRVGYPHVVHEWELVELAVRGLVARGEHRWSAAHRRAGLAH